MSTSLNTPKEDRTSEFYEDQFCSLTNWGPGEFEKFCEVIGYTEEDPDDFFGHQAWRCWNAMTPAQRADFASDFDDWLDA